MWDVHAWVQHPQVSIGYLQIWNRSDSVAYDTEDYDDEGVLVIFISDEHI